MKMVTHTCLDPDECFICLHEHIEALEKSNNDLRNQLKKALELLGQPKPPEAITEAVVKFTEERAAKYHGLERYDQALRKHQEEIGELWNADPNCWHELDPKCRSGIRCLKCRGWFCL